MAHEPIKCVCSVSVTFASMKTTTHEAIELVSYKYHYMILFNRFLVRMQHLPIETFHNKISLP